MAFISTEEGPNCERRRQQGQSYADVVEEIKPDILIEDDCASIGGAKEMCITNVRQDFKEKIHSVVVKEFSGTGEVEQEVARLLTTE